MCWAQQWGYAHVKILHQPACTKRFVCGGEKDINLKIGRWKLRMPDLPVRYYSHHQRESYQEITLKKLK
jgi:hypothetical protein